MNKLILPAIILPLITCVSQATTITTFSFLNDTWNNPTTSQVGFLSQTAAGANNSSTGTVTKDGITLTFTGSFVGTAVSSSIVNGTQGPSFTNATSINPNGFIMGTDNDTNPLTFTSTSFSGAVTNYQRWDFSFSQSVVLNNLVMEDIDSNGTTGGFRDIIAAESFLTMIPGTPGTGVAASYTLFGSPSSLLLGDVTFNGESISAVGAPLGLNNPNNTAPVRARVSLGSGPISSFSVYSFSDRDSDHRLSLNSSSFEVSAVPEPSSALLGILSLVALFRRRR